MISGATGAMAVVMVSPGRHPWRAATCSPPSCSPGLLQAPVWLRLGKFIRLVPFPVMLAFVNGLAIVIFLAQLKQFEVPGLTGPPWLSGSSFGDHARTGRPDDGNHSVSAKDHGRGPCSLAAIVTVTLLVIVFGLDARTVQDVLHDMTGNPAATIAGGLPSFSIPTVP